ncbi:helix-turn-helix domain-containing protein [Pseudonocardia hispaniensis]|uniref:Helix-turn-helix domain-containing protein n=1 Tax=Pseudonocardia hispaniensis TaxID=904933 RepID=A0ABW1IX39_9PSEU
MSVRVMSLVWDSTVPAPERFTLLALADRADEDGRCWPSIGTLAQKCCTGESTVRRHLAALEQQRVITVQRRFNASSLYTISLDRLRELAADNKTPSQSDTPSSQSDRGCQSDTPSQSERTPPVKLSGPPSQSEHLSIIDPSVDPSGGPRKRGTRIPDDFVVTDEMKAWARTHTPLVGQAESDLFVDYWQAESGAHATKRDWRKAWQVWMRREQKRVERRRPTLRSVPAPRASDPDAAFADLRRRGAALEASRLIEPNWIEPSQPPDDPTPPREWLHARRVEWIDTHAAAIRAALANPDRRTG